MSRPSPPLPRNLREPAVVPPPSPKARPNRAPAPELQLAIAKTGIGLELAAPAHLACLVVRELSASLPDLRFPIDVSGGVGRFRHRRGRLDRLVLELPRAALETWASSRLRGVLGVAAPVVTLLVRRGGATVGVVDADLASCLAFELELDGEGDHLALSVHDARGAGLPGPATALAIRAVHAASTGNLAVRAGARFLFPEVARRVAVTLFPELGARAPDASGLVWTVIRGQEDGWLLLAQRDEKPAEPSPLAILARESAALARAGDDAAFGLDLDKARGLLVAALERAPRHRELSRRVAEIDHAYGGRAEAALATLRDAYRDPSAGDGFLLAVLLAEAGDKASAVAAFTRTGETEPVGPLAAAAYQEAAVLTTDPYDALAWMDRAVARAPGLAGPRWARLSMRLTVGRVDDARADAEHLEALASGAKSRHAVWLRAGRAFRDAGWRAESALLFERALRYDPRDAEATAGLGAALVASGKMARGAELLTRAVKMSESNRTLPMDARAQLDLAKVLAEALGDKPAAIARVGEIPAYALEALPARGLEGRWRADIGDVAGGSLAFARARDLAEARREDLSEAGRREAVATLHEAATFETTIRFDWLAAQRHLGTALRLAPDDEPTRAAYREIGRRVAGLTEAEAASESPVSPRARTEPAPSMSRAWDAEPKVSLGDLFAAATSDPATVGGEVDEAEDHARVEELTRKLHADPTDDRVVDELADRLMRLGRTHELFALLSARLDEAPADRRGALLPKQREVLWRLEQDAATAGRLDEAALFREALEAL